MSMGQPTENELKECHKAMKRLESLAGFSRTSLEIAKDIFIVLTWLNYFLSTYEETISTGASPVKPDGSAGLSESRVTQTDPEKQLGLHDGKPAKPENTKT